MYSIVLMMAMSGPAAEAPTFGRHGCHGSTSCHGGFLGGEYGMAGEPEAFATTLRKTLIG